MKKKLKKSVILLFLFFSNVVFPQWTYDSLKELKEEMIIDYEVTYENDLTEAQKSSYSYIKRITVILSKDKLVEKIFDSNNICTQFNLFDYSLNKYTNCTVYSKSGTTYNSVKRGVTYNFPEPNKKTFLIQKNSKSIANLICDKYSVGIGKGLPKNIFTTKKIGLRYCNDFDVKGFVLEYPGYSSSLGNYTVKAVNAYSANLSEKFFSLEGYAVLTDEEVKKNYKEYQEEKAEKNASHIGEKCPKFRVRTIDNKKISFKEYTENKKIIVLNFWFTTCGPCKSEIPKLNELKAQFKDDPNVEFVAFALDDKETVQKFLLKYPLNYDIVDDSRWNAQMLEITSYPTNVIVDQEGIIQFFKTGYSSTIKNMMMSKIDELLEN